MGVLWSKKLIKVSSKDNNNKFWNVTVYDDGTFLRERGRVNSTPRTKKESGTSSQAETLMRKKLKENYKEVAILDDNSKGIQNQNLESLAMKQLVKDSCKEKESLIKELVETNIHGILLSTNLSYNKNSGVFSTPMGIVDLDSIKKATKILKLISQKTQSQKFDKDWIQMCEDYLMIIPHSVGSKLNLP